MSFGKPRSDFRTDVGGPRKTTRSLVRRDSVQAANSDTLAVGCMRSFNTLAIGKRLRRISRKWQVLGGCMIAILAVAFAIAFRSKSGLDGLYQIAKGVGVSRISYYPTKSGGVTGIIPSISDPSRRSRGPTGVMPATVLAFSKKDQVQVHRILREVCPLRGPKTPKWAVPTGNRRGMTEPYANDTCVATVIYGEGAESVAMGAGIHFPSDGFIVMLSEEPDWFSARFYSILHEIGL